MMKRILNILAFLVSVVIVTVTQVSPAASDVVVASFLEHLQEKRYEDAAKLLDAEVRVRFSEQKLRGLIEEFESERTYDRSEVGELKVLTRRSKKNCPAA